MRIAVNSNLCKIVPQAQRPMTLPRYLDRLGRLLTFTLAAAALIHVRAESLPLRTYTSVDGLGSGFVNSISQDSQGFIWFSTRDGLSRFDGAQFVTFQIGSDEVSPNVESVVEMPDGNYLIATSGGTFWFDPATSAQMSNSRLVIDAQLVSGSHGDIYTDKRGRTWLAVGEPRYVEKAESGYRLVDAGLPIPPDISKSLRVQGFAETSDGSLWINCTTGLVREYPDGRVDFHRLPPELTATNSAITVDRTDRLWIARSGDLYVLKPSNDAPSGDDRFNDRDIFAGVAAKPLSPDGIVEPSSDGGILRISPGAEYSAAQSKGLIAGRDGSIWLAAESVLYNFRGGAAARFDHRHGLPRSMTRIFEDRSGNVWIAGQSSLVRLDRLGMTTFGADADTANATYVSVGKGPDGRMYFGKARFETAEFDGARMIASRPILPPGSQSRWTSRHTFRDSTGRWWVLSTSGAAVFSPTATAGSLDGRRPDHIYTQADGLVSNAAFQIFEDSAGTIWVSSRGSGTGSADNGVARLRKGAARFEQVGEELGFPPAKAASAFAEDASGGLWMVFYTGGVARFDGERFTYYSEKEQPQFGQTMTDILVTPDGSIWLGSSNSGLLKIDPSASPILVKQIGPNDGMASSNIRTLTADRFGRIYAGTARGIDRIDPNTLGIRHFSIANGLASDFVVDSAMDSNGDLWFATGGGVSRISPESDNTAEAAAAVKFGSVRIAGVEQPISLLGAGDLDRGDLSSQENNFQIGYFALGNSAGDSVRFQYKLEGADEDWSQPTTVTSLNFANLRPADYRLMVRSITPDGASFGEPATLRFTILPPIWQRRWFTILAALIVIGVGYLIYRYRTARLLEVNAALSDAKAAEERLRRSREERIVELERVRSRIATDLHDDIGASLTQIAILSEVARASGGPDSAISTKPLSKITEISSDLIGTMSDIVWSINPTKDHFSDLVKRMRRFAADLLSEQGITVRFDEPSDLGEIVLDSNVRREIYLIFKEAVNNIAKHARADEVSISLDIAGDDVTFEIRDNGVGFDMSNPEGEDADDVSGNGLASMRRRALANGGVAVVESVPGEGTVVRVRMPRNQAFDESLIPNAKV